jgi:hypothetical protein
MSRRLTVPAYRLHKQSGQAIVTLTDALGNRRDVLLGKYESPASRAEYAGSSWNGRPPAGACPREARKLPRLRTCPSTS